MLEEVLTKDAIKVKYFARDRTEAVRESGRLLVKVGAATPNYVDAMIKNVDVNGTYIVIAPGVGSSMMERLFAQQILDAEKIEAEVDASDISSVDPNAYDLVITTSDFANQLSESLTPIIRLDNLMDKAYLKSELLKNIADLNQSREIG